MRERKSSCPNYREFRISEVRISEVRGKEEGCGTYIYSYNSGSTYNHIACVRGRKYKVGKAEGSPTHVASPSTSH
jgi:hypothetical protein